ncbi:MAG: DUF2959 domain-containing protein [Rhodobacteraceae bacterium]|nr:DUF2959 domain-containing protein [Paracoccaceae bacterium]
MSNGQVPRYAPALLACLLMVGGCQSAYYATMEKFGYEKRDLLKEAVVDARDEQKDAGKEFKDALTRLKELTGYDGGRLEAAYNRLKSDYEDCESAAQAVRERITKMDRIATDLFAEWESEIGQISNANFAADSRRKLSDTRTRYNALGASLRSAEATMEPVLRQFKDYVLYLKHNLNAQAIASLKGEAASIQNDIARLIDQMNASIKQADEFVRSMP